MDTAMEIAEAIKQAQERSMSYLEYLRTHRGLHSYLPLASAIRKCRFLQGHSKRAARSSRSSGGNCSISMVGRRKRLGFQEKRTTLLLSIKAYTFWARSD